MKNKNVIGTDNITTELFFYVSTLGTRQITVNRDASWVLLDAINCWNIHDVILSVEVTPEISVVLWLFP